MAMTKEQIKERIEKATDKLAKAEKKAYKYGNLIDKQYKDLIDKCHENGKSNSITFRKELEELPFSIASKIYSYNDALNEIISIKGIVKNYENKLIEIENFENQDKIQVMVEFLNNWGKKAYDFYFNNAIMYCDLKVKETEEENKWLKSHPYLPGYELSYRNAFRKKYYEDITSLAMNIVNNAYRKVIDTEKLTKIIEDEKTLKYKDFVARITKEVGEITDVSALSIGGKQGEINGIVIGKNGKARVETIMAGGYNIQCLHYRVLVKKFK